MSLSALVRTALNRRLHDRGYSLRWLPPKANALGMTMEVSFEMLAAHLMLSIPQPFFVGIGANDGVTHDPIYPFIRDQGWRGVMIEPIPETFSLLEHNYVHYPEVKLVQAAIGTSDSTATIYSADIGSGGPRNMSLHASFDRNLLLQARKWYPDIESRIVERQVPVLCFTTLMERIGRPKVDVLKIDTEGHDLEILKTIDLHVVRPRLIVAEQANLSRGEKIQMADLLLGAGYRISMTHLDMLGYRIED